MEKSWLSFFCRHQWLDYAMFASVFISLSKVKALGHEYTSPRQVYVHLTVIVLLSPLGSFLPPAPQQII